MCRNHEQQKSKHSSDIQRQSEDFVCERHFLVKYKFQHLKIFQSNFFLLLSQECSTTSCLTVSIFMIFYKDALFFLFP